MLDDGAGTIARSGVGADEATIGYVGTIGVYGYGVGTGANSNLSSQRPLKTALKPATVSNWLK